MFEEPADESQWQYVAVVDDRTCLGCLQHDGQVMTWAEARVTFPNLSRIDEATFNVNQHPNCRCWLVKVAEAPEGPEVPEVEREVGFVYWGGELEALEAARYTRRLTAPFMYGLAGLPRGVRRGRVPVPGTAGEAAVTVPTPEFGGISAVMMETRMALTGARLTARFVPELMEFMPFLGWASIFLSFLTPVIRAVIAEIVEQEARKKLEEYERKRAEIYREAYRSVFPE